MRRKVKRYDEGGILRDRYGNPVKSGSGEPIRTRYGSKEDKKSESVEDTQSIAAMGARAGASSPFAGPKEYISETKETEIEPESPKGIAANFSAKRYLEEPESKGESTQSETAPSKPSVAKKTVKKPAPKYEDTAAKVGSQGNFKFEQPKDTSRGLRLAPGSIAEKIANKISSALDRSQKVGTEAMKESARQARADKVRRNVGSNLETYGMKKGGKVSSASSRADGIAQRGKTRGRIC